MLCGTLCQPSGVSHWNSRDLLAQVLFLQPSVLRCIGWSSRVCLREESVREATQRWSGKTLRKRAHLLFLRERVQRRAHVQHLTTNWTHTVTVLTKVSYLREEFCGQVRKDYRQARFLSPPTCGSRANRRCGVKCSCCGATDLLLVVRSRL